MLYRNASGYFREKYDTRLTKICVDGGFSCPNRDGKCGNGGCIYCGERGAGEHIENHRESIRAQVENAISGKSEKEKFVVYFQNFTNTYADIETLRERYDASLIDERIVALAIGTRPDCIDEQIARLIASYKTGVDVWVELGLQTANDETARIINRGYDSSEFTEACEILRKYGIDVVAHMIIGLPGENKSDALNTAKFIVAHGVSGIKIHSIYVMRGTALEKMYSDGLYTPPTLEEYAEAAAEVLTIIPEQIVIHRLTGDCSRDMLIAPKWNERKTAVIDAINEILNKNGLRQGSKALP